MARIMAVADGIFVMIAWQKPQNDIGEKINKNKTKPGQRAGKDEMEITEQERRYMRKIATEMIKRLRTGLTTEEQHQLELNKSVDETLARIRAKKEKMVICG